MARLNLAKAVAPSAPAAGEIEVFVDSADGRLKLIDGDTGFIYPLSAAEFDKNVLINGGFDFAQRQVAGTLTPYATSANRQYAADRWAMMVQTSSLQYQRIDTAGALETSLTARMYGKFKQITGAGKAALVQWVEGSSAAALRGRRVRVQVKMKRTVAGAMTVRVGLVQLAVAGTLDAPPTAFVSAYGANGTDPTFGANIALVAPDGAAVGGAIAASALTCVLTGNWVQFAFTVTVPTTCKNVGVAIWTDSQLAVNDELNVSEVGLFDGPDLMDWVPQTLANEVHRCQRFYSKSFAIDANPVQNAGVNTGEQKTKKIVAGATAGRFETITFPVLMRITPTITFFNPAAANVQARDETNNADTTVTTAVGTTDRQFAVTFTGNAATVAEGLVGVHWSADAEI